MSPSYTGSGADAIFSAYSDVQGQRSQLAQYAINRAAQYMQDNKTDEAIGEFKKALSFDSQNSTALTYIGKLYLSQGRTSEAIKSFKELVRQQPLSVNALVNLGNSYLQDKQYVESEKQFQKAARLDPLNPVADYTLGIQYLQTDRVKEAKEQFLKVQKISPKDGNVYFSLGTVANKEGNYEEAVKNLKQALTLKQNFPAADYELGVAYANLGQIDKAQEQYKILAYKDRGLARDLKFILDKPKIISMDTRKSGGFVQLMGPSTPLWALDPTLITPDSSKIFSVKMQFSNEMDIASVSKPSNWSITRGKGAESGYYLPIPGREVNIPKIPLAVTYNAVTREATISFRISQNSDGNATIDPKHLVFTFTGKDAAGRSMDTTADQIDGYALEAF